MYTIHSLPIPIREEQPAWKIFILIINYKYSKLFQQRAYIGRCYPHRLLHSCRGSSFRKMGTCCQWMGQSRVYLHEYILLD
nr:MAG TPA: hypothetical protein [Bacteriophage sp.]